MRRAFPSSAAGGDGGLGQPPSRSACEESDQPAAAFCVEHGCDPTAADGLGRTPQQIGRVKGHCRLLQWFEQRVADSRVDNDGRSGDSSGGGFNARGRPRR